MAPPTIPAIYIINKKNSYPYLVKNGNFILQALNINFQHHNGYKTKKYIFSVLFMLQSFLLLSPNKTEFNKFRKITIVGIP